MRIKSGLFALLAIVVSLACSGLASAADEAAATTTAAPEEMAAPADGSIVHTELFAKDLAAMQSFYGDLFGWQFMPMDENYLLFEDANGNSGGFTTMGGPEGGEPGRMTTTIYLYCSDLKSKLAEISAHGGNVVEQITPIPGFGYFAIFTDPSGNPVGLFNGTPPPDDAAAPQH